jgi:colanic acid/amylovoran biosynthesis glycosyltransferase
MRILVLARSFPSASQTFVTDQVTDLIDRGHDVDIWAWWPGEIEAPVADDRYRLDDRTRYLGRVPRSGPCRLARAAIELTRGMVTAPSVTAACLRPSRVGPSARSLRALIEFAPVRHGHAYDVALCHFGPVGRSAVRMRDVGLLDAPIATVFHGSDMTRVIEQQGERTYARLFAAGDLFLPISERWRNRLIELGAPAERTQVHRMGVETTRFAYRARGREPGAPIRLVSVARLVEKKGLEFAIRAIARVREQGVDVRFVVAGDGPERDRLEGLIRELGLGDVVTLAGWCSHERVAQMLDEGHLLLQPSVVAADGDQEGLPVALMEAMAMGLPVVTTRHSGIPELVEDGVHGRMVGERDVEALAAAIVDLAERSDEWPAMGLAGRRAVEASFARHRLGDELEAILARLSRTEPRAAKAAASPAASRG